MTKLKLILVVLLATAVGVILGLSLNNHGKSATQPSANEPLYWVAPMDDNYRRDKPGKSPMGMDLVPVYADDNKETADTGRIYIEPHVVNNLGVKTVRAEMKSVKSRIETFGYVQYDEEQILHVHPRVSGWVEKLYVKALGEPIQKGEPLYTLYSPPLVNAQEELLIALKQNNRGLINAATTRLRALHIPSSLINKLKRTRKVQQNVTFYAPRSGVLDGLKIREGFYVEPGNTLMSIANLEQVWVEAQVFERDAPSVKVGQHVEMTLDFLPGKVWQGQIDYIYPTLNNDTRSLRVRLKFVNDDQQLKPNMYAKVTIYQEVNEPMLLVPNNAVIRTGEQNRVVLAYGNGEFKTVEVQLGQVLNGKTQILAGIQPGDQVVISAQFLIDSESSKSSDFLRIDTSENKELKQVWAKGVIKALNANGLTIEHAAVDEWGWPEMTMDFAVKGPEIMSGLEVDQIIDFKIVNTANNQYLIERAFTLLPTEFPTAKVEGLIESVDPETRMVTITREAIEKWQRDAATMDFYLSDDLALDDIEVGAKIEFQFIVDDEFIIIDWQPIPQPHFMHSHHSHSKTSKGVNE